MSYTTHGRRLSLDNPSLQSSNNITNNPVFTDVEDLEHVGTVTKSVDLPEYTETSVIPKEEKSTVWGRYKDMVYELPCCCGFCHLALLGILALYFYNLVHASMRNDTSTIVALVVLPFICCCFGAFIRCFSDLGIVFFG